MHKNMKGDGLRLRLEQALKNKYPGYLTTYEVDAICDELGYKRNNGERRLRLDKTRPTQWIPNEKIYKGGAVAGYKWKPEGSGQAPLIGGAPRAEAPKSEPAKADDLNGRLIELLKKVPKTWENADIIKRINKAIKSRFEEEKKGVLGLYKDF